MYPHHVFDLEPAGTFGMYPICYWWVSGRYFQPEPAMYSRCFHWFPGPLAPSEKRMDWTSWGGMGEISRRGEEGEKSRDWLVCALKVEMVVVEEKEGYTDPCEHNTIGINEVCWLIEVFYVEQVRYQNIRVIKKKRRRKIPPCQLS